MNRAHQPPAHPQVLMIPIALLAACSSGGDEPIDLGPTTPSEAAAAAPLVLGASNACALDADCAAGRVCFQGACSLIMEGGPRPSEVLEVVPDLAIMRAPSRIQRVRAGQDELTVTLTLDGPVPATGLAYRIERTDESSDAPTALHVAPADGDSVIIRLNSGAADPLQDAPEMVYVNLVTAAGTARFILAPELPEGGTYGGQAVIETFGQLGLPMEFDVVTDPPGSSLAEANAAYVVLPIEEGNLWNPMPPVAGGPSHVTRALVYDDFVRAWVAQFELPYEMTPTSPFSWTKADTNASTRRLRLEILSVEDGVLIGNVSDRWSGLLEARTEAGVLAPTDVAFVGTFELQRYGAAPELESVTPPVDYAVSAAGLLPYPSVGACQGVAFDATGSVNGALVDCGVMANESDFVAADPDAQASCALAMVEVALDGQTTAAQIEAFLDDSTPNPGGQSFADFMRACAAQDNGTCVTSDEILCARQLAAYAIKNGTETSTSVNDLLLAYQEATREAFLGRQFAAFHADAQTRLDWLKAQDYPAIVTSAVQGLIQQLLEDWQSDVLEAHISVLGGQFDSAGGAVLGQQITDADALNRHRLLLFETSQSWRGAADALALGAGRWDTLLSDPQDRDVKGQYVYDRMLDLYIVAGVLAEMNREAGSGGNNAVFGGGFRPLVKSSRQLAQPFDRLIYDRQAEVVVSTSLDPMQSNATILSGLQTHALQEVGLADDAVTEVIAQSQAELLKQAELTSRIANEADTLQTEIATVCGLPEGCTVPDDAGCSPRVQLGQCGFRVDATGAVLDAAPSDANPSQAGAAILEVQAALLEMTRAEEAVRAHAAQVDLKYQTGSAFAQQVQNWNAERRTLVGSMQGNLSAMSASADAAIVEMAVNFAATLSVRETRVTDQEAFIASWDQVAVDGVEADIEDMVDIAVTNAVAAGLNATADAIDHKAKAVTEGMPKSVGLSNDASAPARLAVFMSSYYLTTAMRGGALIAESQASRMERSLIEQQGLREAELKVLELEDELSAAVAEQQAESFRNQASLVQAATEFELNILREMNDLLERETQIALAYERDLVELRDRRDEVMEMLVETKGLELHVMQAELTVEQALLKYERAVRQAQLLSGRHDTVRNQLDNINQIIGSPTAVFAWANRLSRAEARLEAAKAAVMEWLIALEYFAVRPFFDQRIQILLARNTTQLEAIARDLVRIQGSCGGAVNTQTVDVSLRNDLLGINQSMVDLQTGDAVAPEDRFRALLDAGRIPVDKRVRYRSDSTVGDLINRGGVLSATFELGMDDFANLDTTCNAKMAAVSVRLVGEGLGDARPTVNLLYDGTSRLRSCQPDISAIVELVGSDVTPFSEVTQLRTPGRSISLLAGIEELPAAGSENRSLGGLPLVSQYTVLIDPMAGENDDIDWSKLDDIEMRVEYSYQDLFPAGQCQ